MRAMRRNRDAGQKPEKPVQSQPDSEGRELAFVPSSIVERQVKVGESFSVELDTIAGTGFEWNVVSCPKGIIFLGRTFSIDVDLPQIMGGLIKEIFDFMAIEKGTFIIRFDSKMYFEDEVGEIVNCKVLVA